MSGRGNHHGEGLSAARRGPRLVKARATPRALLAAAAVLAVLLALMLIVVLAGCGSDQGNTAETAAADAATATGTTGKQIVPSRSIESIEQEASRLRGLPIKSPIAVSYLSRDELRLEMKKQLEEEYKPGELATEEKVLKKLGLMAPDESLESDVEQMLAEEVAGYYDDQTKELKLISDIPELDLMNQVTLAHESTHALQDQNFSLSAFLQNATGGSGNDDQDLARMSLVEGDATLVERDFMSNFSALDMASVLLGSLSGLSGLGGNSYLEGSLMFPYTKGMIFVDELRARGGWAAVNAAYVNPPQSSEQIMHPEKYPAGDTPKPVRASSDASLLASGWTQNSQNVLGEFGIDQLLSLDIPQLDAKQAAEGWGGDSLRYYEGPNGATMLLLQTEWDTSKDATEFATAMGEALESRYGGKFDLKARPAPVLKAGNGGVWMLVQHGTYVAVLQAPDEATGAPLM